MPQIPSPNMGIIWPTDGDDANAWAPIMDQAVRGVIDGHNHAAGNGAQISIGSLKFDADISFVDALGGKHAITNLKTISFFPSPPPVGTNGSFFIADGTSGTVVNELYYRTTLGTNVQMTTGGTLNVAGFAGGIGGDYSGVSALESFLDAQNAYQFFQQLGASVRQFAKLQSADLSLFEFRAHGASPVPTQAVTLRSPAALALGYVLTFPGALPSVGAANSPLAVDSTGAITFGGVQTLQIPVVFGSGVTNWRFATFSAGTYTVPIQLPNGSRIVAVRLRFQDNATGPTKLTVGLQSVVDGGAPTTIATSAVSAGSGANQTLAATGIATVIASGTNYNAVATITTGAANCTLYWFEVDYDRP